MKKVIEYMGKEYTIENEDDLVFWVHKLANHGLYVKEIAFLFGISQKKVKEILGID